MTDHPITAPIPDITKVPGLTGFDPEGQPLWADEGLDVDLEAAAGCATGGDQVVNGFVDVAITLTYALSAGHALDLLDVYRKVVLRAAERAERLAAAGITPEGGKAWERSRRPR